MRRRDVNGPGQVGKGWVAANVDRRYRRPSEIDVHGDAANVDREVVTLGAIDVHGAQTSLGGTRAAARVTFAGYRTPNVTFGPFALP
jgi:hypothetical protein